MPTYLHRKSEDRGRADHGWLKATHSFSFGNYYDPKIMGFRALRVINEDRIAGGGGFPTHPHDNMEIVTYILDGALEHRDSIGSGAVIRPGEAQRMSAGTGIQHSEYNKNENEAVKFLQIWIYPNKKNVAPRYDQVSLKMEDRKNKLQQVLSPNSDDEGVWVHQDAWFHLGTFDNGAAAKYAIKKQGNGVYAFVLKGKFNLDGIDIENRDGLGIWETEEFLLTSSEEGSEILLMEVPM